MATLMAISDNTLTTAATWSLTDTASNNISGNITFTALTTGNTDSTAFTPTNNAVQYLGIKLGARASGTPTNTMTIHLRNSTTSTNVLSWTINVSDLPVCNTTDNNGGWIFLKASASHTPNGTNTYVVRATLSSTSTAVSLAVSATTNLQRILGRTTTQAPAAGDDMYVSGWYDNASNPCSTATRTVTMDSSAATDYGSANPSSGVPGLAIGQRGTVIWLTTASITRVLQMSANVIIHAGGTWTRGTSGSPIPRTSTATLQFDCASDGQFGRHVRSGATVTDEGQSNLSGVTETWGLLNGDEAAAQTVLSIDRQISAANGQDIAIASTSATRTEAELRVLASDAGASTVTVTAGLTNSHLGTNGQQADVISLSRNVRTISTSSSFMTFDKWNSGSTVAVRWCEYRYGGSGSNYAVELAGASQTLEYCSVRDSDGVGIGVTSTATGATVRHVVGYNINGANTNATFLYIDPAATTATVDDVNFVWGVTTTCYGIQADNPNSLTQFDNIRVCGCGTGILVGDSGNSDYNGNGKTFNDWVMHNNATNVYFGASASALTIDGLTVYGPIGGSNGQVQIVGSSFLTIANMAMYAGGATTRGVWFVTGAHHVLIRDSNLGGAGSQAVTLSGTLMASDVVFHNCNFGTNAGGFYTSSTLDVTAINSTNNNFYYDLTFVDCVFDQSTAVSWHTSGRAKPGCRYRFQKSDGVDGTHFTDVYGIGTITRETTTVDVSPSWKLTPASATIKLDSAANLSDGGFYVPVDSGSTPTVSIKVQKDASYNGNAARLVLKANPAVGVDSDQVIDTHSIGSGSFETLSGVCPAANAKGIYRFVVDCDGTAGNIFIDTFSVTGAATSSSTGGLAYSNDGLPC